MTCPFASTSAVSTLLSHTWDRDRLMGVMQFTPMALEGVLRAIGPNAAGSCMQLSALSDKYRAFTRFQCIFDVLDERKLKSMESIQDPVEKTLTQAETVFLALFHPTENFNFLINNDVLGCTKGRYGDIQTYFWLMSLLCGDLKHAYALYKMSQNATQDKKACKSKIIDLIKSMCFTLFAISLLPKGGKKPMLFIDAANPIAKAANGVVAITTVPTFNLTDVQRGMLGLTATLLDCYQAWFMH